MGYVACSSIGEGRSLYLTEISREMYEEQCSNDFDTDCGLFIVFEDVERGIYSVIAKAVSDIHGRSLMEVLTRTNAGPRPVPI